MDNGVYEFVKKKIQRKYRLEEAEFQQYWNIYKELPKFKINENLWEKMPNLGSHIFSDILHDVILFATEYYITKAFDAMLIDMDDPNVAEGEENYSTPYRIAKMWVGSNFNDDKELLSGRFAKPVRLAKFPNNNKDQFPIIKEVDLTAVCSHHLLPFSTKFLESSRVIIAYIPEDYVLGISKLQRVVRNIAQRGWLQEDLTKALYDEISKSANSPHVYIKLKNIKHSCEFLRGALTDSDGFTTEYYGGKFKEDKDLLEMVRNY